MYNTYNTEVRFGRSHIIHVLAEWPERLLGINGPTDSVMLLACSNHIQVSKTD